MHVTFARGPGKSWKSAGIFCKQEIGNPAYDRMDCQEYRRQLDSEVLHSTDPQYGTVCHLLYVYVIL